MKHFSDTFHVARSEFPKLLDAAGPQLSVDLNKQCLLPAESCDAENSPQPVRRIHQRQHAAVRATARHDHRGGLQRYGVRDQCVPTPDTRVQSTVAGAGNRLLMVFVYIIGSQTGVRETISQNREAPLKI